MNRKHLMFAVGLCVTVVALWYSLRDVQFSEFTAALRQFHYVWLIPALLFFYYSMYLRAVRWGLLFRPYFRFKGREVYPPIMICFCFNGIFPFRVGEVARAIYAGKRLKTGVTTALATVVAERILDGVTLLLMLAFALWLLPPMDPTFKMELWGKTFSAEQFHHISRSITIGSIVLTLGMIVFMIPVTQRLMAGVIQRLPLLSAGLRHKLEATLKQFAMGFHALQQPAVLAQIVFQSVVLWLLVGVSNLMMAKGFGLPMNLAQATALVTLVAIAIILPAAPGYWGLFEVGVMFSLVVLRVLPAEARSQALAYALMVHLVQYIPLVLIGLYFAWRTQLRPSEAAEAALEETDQPAEMAAK